jgi:hypothetical protein
MCRQIRTERLREGHARWIGERDAGICVDEALSTEEIEERGVERASHAAPMVAWTTYTETSTQHHTPPESDD